MLKTTKRKVSFVILLHTIYHARTVCLRSTHITTYPTSAVHRQMGARGKIVFGGHAPPPPPPTPWLDFGDHDLVISSYLYLEHLNFLHWMPPNFHFGVPFESGARGKLPPLPPFKTPLYPTIIQSLSKRRF